MSMDGEEIPAQADDTVMEPSGVVHGFRCTEFETRNLLVA